MTKKFEFDPLLESIRKHSQEIKNWDEKDKEHFCTNWDLCRDRLMELTHDSFENIERLMHEWGDENKENFEEFFCSPFLLAAIILIDTNEEILRLRKEES